MDNSTRRFRKGFTKIKDISEIRRLPRLGKIRLGMKVVIGGKKNSKCKCKKKGEPGCYFCMRPKEVDYFITPKEVQEVFGKEPKELEIMMPVNDMQVIFPQAYKWYGSGAGVKCVGDGEKALRVNPKGGMDDIKCPCKHLRGDQNPRGECGVVANLLFLIPKVSFGGVYQIDTGSINSIIDVQSGLEYTANMVASVTGDYRFNMIPLKLKRVEKSTHGSGRKEIHYTLQIEPSIDINGLTALMENPRVIPNYQVEVPKLVEAPDVSYKDQEDDKIIDAESTDIDEKKSESTKPKEDKDKSKKKDQKVNDPMQMSRVELINWLKVQRGAKYVPELYDSIKANLFGNTPMKDITIEGFQNFYEKLEKEALIKANETT